MKKTLLALAVLTAAGSVSAANLYEEGNTSVNVSGEVDILLKTLDHSNDVTGLDKSNDPEISGWAVTQFDIDHKISDAVTVFGSFEIEGDNGGAAKFDDTRIGFKGDFGKVTLGETGSSYALLEKAELTNEGADADVVYDSSESKGHGIRYQIDLGPVALSADIQTAADENTDADYAFGADYAIGDFTIGAAYLQGKESANYDSTAVGVSASYEANGLYVAATYTQYEGQSEVNIEGGDSTGELTAHDGNSMGVAVSYKIEEVKIYAAYHMINADKDTAGNSVDGDLTNYYVGAEYAVSDNLTAFGEYNAADIEGTSIANQDMSQFIAGLYLSF